MLLTAEHGSGESAGLRWGETRCLIVSPGPLGGINATGALMRTLFEGMAPQQLATIVSLQLAADPLHAPNTMVANVAFAKPPSVSRRIVNKILGHGYPENRVGFGKLMRWVCGFSPHVIYYRPVDGPIWLAEMALRLQRELRVPMVTHIMDDWPARLTEQARRGEVAPKAALRAEELYQRAVAASATNLAISPGMAAAFESRYGARYDVVHNGIDSAKPRTKRLGQTLDEGKSFQVGYSGTLASDMQLQSVIDVARAVAKLRDQGLNIEFLVRTHEFYRDTFDSHLECFDGTVGAAHAPADQYAESLAQPNLLLIPANFDQLSVSYIRYSLSNKLPECLASGTPVFGYGPANVETIRILLEENAAEVVTRQCPETLENAIRRLYESQTLREQLAARGARCVARRFDLDAIRTRFRQHINQATHLGSEVSSAN